jgi:hypothetical protein
VIHARSVLRHVHAILVMIVQPIVQAVQRDFMDIRLALNAWHQPIVLTMVAVHHQMVLVLVIQHSLGQNVIDVHLNISIILIAGSATLQAHVLVVVTVPLLVISVCLVLIRPPHSPAYAGVAGYCSCFAPNEQPTCNKCPPNYAGYLCLPCPGGATNPCGGFGSCSAGFAGTGLCTCYSPVSTPSAPYYYRGLDCMDPVVTSVSPNNIPTAGNETSIVDAVHPDCCAISLMSWY